MGSSSDSSTKGDFFDISTIFILLGAILFFARTWLDVFIVTVNFRDWMKKKRLSMTDRILTLQGGIRISLASTMMMWSILLKFFPWVTRVPYVTRVSTASLWYLMACNVWLTASLCSYYCMKIADFYQPFFIHLKQRLSRMGSAWLLGSAILSLASSLPFLSSDLELRDNKNFSNVFQNKNVTDVNRALVVLPTHTLQGLGYCAAFSICAISAFLLLFSLWRHHQRMLGSWDGHGSPQTNIHFQAVITILVLLVNNVVVFVSIQLLLSKDLEGNFTFHYGVSVVFYSCFSVESLISVWGNKKLKNELRRYFDFAKCRGCVN